MIEEKNVSSGTPVNNCIFDVKGYIGIYTPTDIILSDFPIAWS